MRIQNKHLFNLAFVGCLLLAVVLGCKPPDGSRSSSPTSSNPSNSTSAQTNSAPARPQVSGLDVYKTGETVGVGVFGYQVYGSWYSNKLSGNQIFDQPPDAKYLFVDLGVVNGEKEAYTIPSFKLIDQNNAEYETSSKALAAEGSIDLLYQLNPGVSKRAYVIFDVPEGKSYKLKVSGGAWSGKEALIELSPKAKK